MVCWTDGTCTLTTAGRFAASFAPEADLPGIAAAAGGAYGATVTDAAVLPEALAAALEQVRAGRSAVISVHVPSVEHPATAPGQPGQEEEANAPAS